MYAAMTKDEAQSRASRDRWTFYEAVNLASNDHATVPETRRMCAHLQAHRSER